MKTQFSGSAAYQKIKDVIINQHHGHILRCINDTNNWVIDMWVVHDDIIIVHDYKEDGATVYAPLQDSNNINAEVDALAKHLRLRDHNIAYIDRLSDALRDQGINPNGKTFRDKYLKDLPEL